MSVNEFSIKVPASTANLGPGFDSLGLALGLYMTIHVRTAEVSTISYELQDYKQFDDVESNLIFKAARTTAAQYGKELPPVQLVVETDIPLGRGLGSSASAIAGGIELADYVLDLKLSADEKTRIGSMLEGHPDNVSASIMGGLTVSLGQGEEVSVIRIPVKGVEAVLLIPQTELSTKESRGLLPEKLVYADAIQSSAAANMFCTAAALNDWELAGKMMECDAFHEPYRSVQFPNFNEIRNACREYGAYGSAISGVGPSIFVLCREGEGKSLAEKLMLLFPAYHSIALSPSDEGVQVSEKIR